MPVSHRKRGLSCGSPVFKDGDRYEVDRYRPITLMVVLAKAVEAVIQRRLQEKVACKDSRHASIMGFRKKRSRELALFILVETILYKIWKSRDKPSRYKKVFLLLADESDAFDGMDKQAAEIGLYKAGIRGKMWLLDSAMNKQQRIRVRVNGAAH